MSRGESSGICKTCSRPYMLERLGDTGDCCICVRDKKYEAIYGPDWRSKVVRILERIRRARDAEWTRAIAGAGASVMTPDQAAKWLEHDRVVRARNVSEARVRRGPQHY